MSESDLKTIKDQLALIEEIYQKDRRIAELEAELNEWKKQEGKKIVDLIMPINDFEEGQG